MTKKDYWHRLKGSLSGLVFATLYLKSVSCTCDCQDDTLICKHTDSLNDSSPQCVSNYSEITQLRILYHTNLEVVDDELLSKFTNLLSLDISYNPNLVLITNNSFEGLEHLSSLRISHNKKLMSIPDNCLDGLYNLTKIILAQNGFEDYTTNGFRFCVQVNYLGQYNVLPLGFRFKEAVLVPQKPSKESVDFCMGHRMQLLFEEHQGHPGCEVSNYLIDCSSDKIADSIGTGNSFDFPNGKDEECHFYFNLLTYTYRSYINETGDYRAQQHGYVSTVVDLVTSTQSVNNWVTAAEFNSAWNQLAQSLVNASALKSFDFDVRHEMENNFFITFNYTVTAITTTTTTTTTTAASTPAIAPTSINTPADNNNSTIGITEMSTPDTSVPTLMTSTDETSISTGTSTVYFLQL